MAKSHFYFIINLLTSLFLRKIPPRPGRVGMTEKRYANDQSAVAQGEKGQKDQDQGPGLAVNLRQFAPQAHGNGARMPV